MNKDIDLEIEKMVRANYNVVVMMTSEEGRAISIINRVLSLIHISAAASV